MAVIKKKIDENEEQVSFSSISELENKNNEKEVESKTKKKKTSTSTTNKTTKKTSTTKSASKKPETASKKSTKKDEKVKEVKSVGSKSSTKKSTEKPTAKASTKSSSTKKKATPKKDRKINISQEDMDKLCEVYDWYLSVKDTISYNAATEKAENKDIVIEKRDIKDTKRASINIEREVWEDFDVLCSNLGFKKNEVLTQIIKDFLREHRNLF